MPVLVPPTLPTTASRLLPLTNNFLASPFQGAENQGNDGVREDCRKEMAAYVVESRRTEGGSSAAVASAAASVNTTATATAAPTAAGGGLEGDGGLVFTKSAVRTACYWSQYGGGRDGV